MTTITVSLPADRWQKLREVAAQYRVAPEDLVRASVEELLARPEEEFKQALEYVLTIRVIAGQKPNSLVSSGNGD